MLGAANVADKTGYSLNVLLNVVGKIYGLNGTFNMVVNAKEAIYAHR